jgi:hypothetical protein
VSGFVFVVGLWEGVVLSVVGLVLGGLELWFRWMILCPLSLLGSFGGASLGFRVSGFGFGVIGEG